MPGPAILLVHGFSSSSEASWARNGWLDILADGDRQVIAPDLLGHGDAPKPHDPAEYDLEGQVLALLDGVGDVDAIGFSMGSRLLLTLEIAHPGTFGRLVVGGLGNNLFVPERRHGNVQMADAIEAGSEVLDPLGRAFVAVAQTPPNDPKALAACLRREVPLITPEQLATIRCPVLVVVGENDEMVKPVDALVAPLPDASLVTVKGADHLGTMKGFGFLEAALGFLDALV